MKAVCFERDVVRNTIGNFHGMGPEEREKHYKEIKSLDKKGSDKVS